MDCQASTRFARGLGLLIWGSCVICIEVSTIMGETQTWCCLCVFEHRVRGEEGPFLSQVPCQERHMTSYARHACQ